MGILAIAALAVPGAGAAAGETRPSRDVRALIDRAVSKEDAAAMAALEPMAPAAVSILEADLASACRWRPEQVRALVRELGHRRTIVRERATSALMRLPATVLPLLRELRQAAADPEVQLRLDLVLKEGPTSRRSTKAARLLVRLYDAGIDALFDARRLRLLRDPRDPQAVRFFRYADFGKVWRRFQDRPKTEKLRYLLFRVRYRSSDLEAAREALKPFAATDILRVAAETYWPVEIEPPRRDGAYEWTTRAARVEGNVASHVLRMSLYRPGPDHDKWIHLKRADQWTYLFRYGRMYYNKEAVVYAERLPAAKLPFHDPDPADATGRCDTVRGVPPSARIPTAKISGAESLNWHTGSVYEWVRPWLPDRIRQRLKVRPNRFPPPEVIPPPRTGPPGKDQHTQPRLPKADRQQPSAAAGRNQKGQGYMTNEEACLRTSRNQSGARPRPEGPKDLGRGRQPPGRMPSSRTAPAGRQNSAAEGFFRPFGPLVGAWAPVPGPHGPGYDPPALRA